MFLLDTKLVDRATHLFMCKKEQLEVQKRLLPYRIHMILILN